MLILNDNLEMNNALVARTSKLSRYFSVLWQRVVKTSMSLGRWFELHAACYILYMYVYNKILLVLTVKLSCILNVIWVMHEHSPFEIL